MAKKTAVKAESKSGEKQPNAAKTVRTAKSPKKGKPTKSAKDIYAMRKRKKRRKVLQQTFWMLLLAVTILILYQRRDNWMPKLETIGTKHENHRQGAFGETDGNFPLYVIGGADYQTGTASDKLMVLSDSYLHVYDTDGTLLSVRQHTYGSAMLQTAGEYALVYESGGTRFRLETVQKTHFEKTVADPIVFGRISENGQIVLVTSAESCACKMVVFNQKGQQIYERSCVERLVDVAFHEDDLGCFAASIEASEGSLQSVIHSYSFTQKGELWESEPLDMLAISVYNTIDGGSFVLGDKQSCYLNVVGKVTSRYVYPDELKCGVCKNGTAALVLSNDERRSKSVVILDGSADMPIEQDYDKDIKDIDILENEQSILIQLRNHFETLDYAGTLLQTTPVSDSYEEFHMIGNELFLCSYDHIDKIEYKKPETE